MRIWHFCFCVSKLKHDFKNSLGRLAYAAFTQPFYMLDTLLRGQELYIHKDVYPFHLSIKNSYTEWVYVKYLSNKMFWKIDL